MENTFNQIIDTDIADKQIKENAIRHYNDGLVGYSELIKIGYYGMWMIVARTTYNSFDKTFIYDGGIQLALGGSCDRSGGYTSLQQLIDAAIDKARKDYEED